MGCRIFDSSKLQSCTGSAVLANVQAMPDSIQLVTPVSVTPTWDPDVIFPILADPARRRLLLALARGGPQPGSIAKNHVGKRLDATLKHFGALRRAGLVTTAPDPQDGRRTLYGLSRTLPSSNRIRVWRWSSVSVLCGCDGDKEWESRKGNR